MDKWATVPIGSLGKVFDGPHATPKTVSHGPIFLGIGALQNGRINLGETRHVTLDDFEKWTRRVRPKAGDIVFSYETRLGQAAIIPEGMECCLGRRMGLLRVDQDKILARFFLYNYISPDYQEFLGSRTVHGATVDRILLREFPDFPFPCPPLEEQRAVVSVLGALDDKIELNRQMNETLEGMARAIFKDWFVDFGPTRAKAEGRPPYLSPELWDLFPDAIDGKKKPTGWARERIGRHVAANKGLSYKGAGLTDETNGIPLHNLNSILEGGGYKSNGLKFYAGDYKPRHILQPGDLIVANTEQGFDHLLIGHSALVPSWVGSRGLFSHHIFKVEPRAASPLSRVWLHFSLSSSIFGDAVRRFSNGTTVNMLPQDAFEIPEIIVPPSRLVQAFDDFVDPTLRSQEAAVVESRALAHTRDLLLPKLMSGEIRLREAEKSVEAVA